jgi:3-oxoacyl-[acyl-carrier-protein] synthase III
MVGSRIIEPIFGVSIQGVGLGFAENGLWLSNEDLYIAALGNNWKESLRREGKDVDYLERKLGVKRRYWSKDPVSGQHISGTNAEDLMMKAGNDLLGKTQTSPDEIDFLIAISTTSPRYINSLGPSLSARMGLTCPSIEMKTGCASFLFAMVIASQYIQSGMGKVLIVAGETPSRVVDIGSNLFFAVGDGAGAVLLGRSENNQAGLQYALLGTDASLAGKMGTTGELPPNRFDLENGNYKMKMNADTAETIKDLWKEIPTALSGQLRKLGILPHALCVHQVNREYFKIALENLGLNNVQCPWVLPTYANCGSAGIIMSMAHCDDLLTDGNTTLLVGVGGGISYGGIIWKN